MKSEPIEEVRVFLAGVSYDMNRYSDGWYFRMRPCKRESSWHGPYTSRGSCEHAAAFLAQSGFSAICDPKYR